MIPKSIVNALALVMLLVNLQSISVKVQGTGWGTGIFIAPNRVLTCAHLVEDVEGAVVDVGETNRAGRVTRRNQAYDLALIELNWTSTKYVTEFRLDPELGERVYVVSSVGRFEDLITFGRIAWIGDEIVIDSTILLGMSGSGVFDRRGRLIGVVQQIYGHLRTHYGDFLTLAISAKKVKKFLEAE